MVLSWRQKLGILVFIKTPPVAKLLPWQQHQGCHCVSFVMHIYHFLSSYRNTSGSLGEREMLWEHEPQASVSTAFSSSPKLSWVFLYLDTKNMFSIAFRKHRDKEKENNLLMLITRMPILFVRVITMSTAHASSVSPSNYRNTIFNQSVHVIS